MKSKLKQVLKRRSLPQTQANTLPVMEKVAPLEKPVLPDETVDFKTLFQDVAPLKPNRRHDDSPSQATRKQSTITKATTTTSGSSIYYTLDEIDPPDPPLTHFTQPDVPRLTLKQLRQGKWIIQQTLDLHGLNRHESYRQLIQLIEQPRSHSRCICIIHGKGKRSPSGVAVLKNCVSFWLQKHPAVLAFCEAPPHHGGTGALLVLLRKTPTP